MTSDRASASGYVLQTVSQTTRAPWMEVESYFAHGDFLSPSSRRYEGACSARCATGPFSHLVSPLHGGYHSFNRTARRNSTGQGLSNAILWNQEPANHHLLPSCSTTFSATTSTAHATSTAMKWTTSTTVATSASTFMTSTTKVPLVGVYA